MEAKEEPGGVGCFEGTGRLTQDMIGRKGVSSYIETVDAR